MICRKWYLTFRHVGSEERHPGRTHLLVLPLCSTPEDRIKYMLRQLDGGKKEHMMMSAGFGGEYW